MKPFTVKAVKERDGGEIFYFVEVTFDNGGYWCATPEEIATLISALARAMGKCHTRLVQDLWKRLDLDE